MDAKVSDDLQVEDVEYYRHAGGPVLARLYRPKHVRLAPAVISMHGGRWIGESRLSNAVIDEALARDGAVAGEPADTRHEQARRATVPS